MDMTKMQLMNFTGLIVEDNFLDLKECQRRLDKLFNFNNTKLLVNSISAHYPHTVYQLKYVYGKNNAKFVLHLNLRNNEIDWKVI